MLRDINVWTSEDNTQEPVLAFHHVGFGDQTQATRIAKTLEVGHAATLGNLEKYICCKQCKL